MIIAKGTHETDGGVTTEMLFIGLSHQNIIRLLKGEPIMKDLNFASIPYTLMVAAGEDEIEIHRALRLAGIVDRDTTLNPAPVET